MTQNILRAVSTTSKSLTIFLWLSFFSTLISRETRLRSVSFFKLDLSINLTAVFAPVTW